MKIHLEYIFVFHYVKLYQPGSIPKNALVRATPNVLKNKFQTKSVEAVSILYTLQGKRLDGNNVPSHSYGKTPWHDDAKRCHKDTKDDTTTRRDGVRHTVILSLVSSCHRVMPLMCEWTIKYYYQKRSWTEFRFISISEGECEILKKNVCNLIELTEVAKRSFKIWVESPGLGPLCHFFIPVSPRASRTQRTANRLLLMVSCSV